MQVLIGSSPPAGSAIAVSAEAYEDRVFAIDPLRLLHRCHRGQGQRVPGLLHRPQPGRPASADYMAENMADAKIAVIYRNDDAYSQRHPRHLQGRGRGPGPGHRLARAPSPRTPPTDFSVQLTAAQSAGADLVFLPIYYTPASVIFDPGQRHGLRPHLLRRGRHGRHPDRWRASTPSLAEGVMLLTPFSADVRRRGHSDLRDRVSVEQVRRDPQPVRRRRLRRRVRRVRGHQGRRRHRRHVHRRTSARPSIAAMPTVTLNGLTGTLSWPGTNGEVSKAPAAVYYRGRQVRRLPDRADSDSIQS